MKICPLCNLTYENPHLRFCGEDGSPLKEINPAPPPENVFIEFSSAPVVFEYTYNSGLPGHSHYARRTYAGTLDEQGWKITFRDETPNNPRPAWKIRLNAETGKRLENLMRRVGAENSPTMGAGITLGIQTADGARFYPLFLSREGEQSWERLFNELESYLPQNPANGQQASAPEAASIKNQTAAPQNQPPPVENFVPQARQIPQHEIPKTVQPTAVAAPAVSPSLLILFYAHQFVRAAGILGGTPVPCQDVQVKTADLVHELVAAAFWHLRERKLINLAIGKPQGLIFKTTPVNAQFSQPGELNGGLEHDFFEILRARQTVFTVKDVIITHLRIDSKNPANDLFERAQQWAVHQGFARAVQKKGLVFTKTEIEYDCAKIGALINEAQAIQPGWQQFKAQEAALYAALVKECQGAISARTERDDYDNDYSSFD
jgi:hypothetical protein